MCLTSSHSTCLIFLNTEGFFRLVFFFSLERGQASWSPIPNAHIVPHLSTQKARWSQTMLWHWRNCLHQMEEQPLQEVLGNSQGALMWQKCYFICAWREQCKEHLTGKSSLWFGKIAAWKVRRGQDWPSGDPQDGDINWWGTQNCQQFNCSVQNAGKVWVRWADTRVPCLHWVLDQWPWPRILSAHG